MKRKIFQLHFWSVLFSWTHFHLYFIHSCHVDHYFSVVIVQLSFPLVIYSWHFDQYFPVVIVQLSFPLVIYSWHFYQYFPVVIVQLSFPIVIYSWHFYQYFPVVIFAHLSVVHQLSFMNNCHFQLSFPRVVISSCPFPGLSFPAVSFSCLSNCNLPLSVMLFFPAVI